MVQQIDKPGLVYSGLAGFISWAFGEANATLLLIAFLAMFADISSGALRAMAVPTEAFTGRRLRHGVVLKMLEVHVVFLGAIIDWTLLTMIPDSAELIKHWMPWTRLALVVLIATEASSMRRNLRAVLNIPDAFDRALKSLRDGDALKAVHEVDVVMAPEGQANKRWSDTMSEGKDAEVQPSERGPAGDVPSEAPAGPQGGDQAP